MLNSLPSLYLASQSPRRKQLLESLGFEFTVLPTAVQEVQPDSQNYKEVILSNSLQKAKAALKEITNQHAVIVSADTLVVVDDTVLGKPIDKKNAIWMLNQMSNKVQRVYTGLTLRSPKFGIVQTLVESKVYFRKITSEEMERYTETVEPYDKAGGYAVQGIGAIFIDKIEGSYTNVMGLPIEVFLAELQRFTHIPIYDWIAKRVSHMGHSRKI